MTVEPARSRSAETAPEPPPSPPPRRRNPETKLVVLVVIGAVAFFVFMGLWLFGG